MSDAGGHDNLAHLSRQGERLPLPTLFLDLLAAERWKHPSGEVLQKVMPWFEDPLDFLTNEEEIRRESRSLFSLAERDGSADLFRLTRGSTRATPAELPWLDVELATLIAVNHFPGDDVAIALDYRTSHADPRVVASDFWTDPHRCAWRTIASTFSAFAITLNLINPRAYGYIGPAELRDEIRPGSRGQPITSADNLASWLANQDRNDRAEPFTFVIDLNGTLRLAPRRSEHVACAGGQSVLSAGEISFNQDHGHWAVDEASNQSTGSCPDVASWAAVQAALERAGIPHPQAFTNPITFRRCPQCHERNIVKDEHFVCALCDAPLPSEWNLNPPES